jgi:hypothetical protein
MGYGLLCVPYPEDIFDLAGRIDGALTANACGDAESVLVRKPHATALTAPERTARRRTRTAGTPAPHRLPAAGQALRP